MIFFQFDSSFSKLIFVFAFFYYVFSISSLTYIKSSFSFILLYLFSCPSNMLYTLSHWPSYYSFLFAFYSSSIFFFLSFSSYSSFCCNSIAFVLSPLSNSSFPNKSPLSSFFTVGLVVFSFFIAAYSIWGFLLFLNIF